ncbi:MAG: 14.7 kDa ribonuclease H-like protein [bacterium ADurb.Bin400]|nr:MAG: 14.7 kDa ribonuclease H-like protein [bacterium ADurb.Bin400]
MKVIYINTDGGSRGNPGPAATGVVFSDELGGVLYTHKEYIGKATNNEAEYQALSQACKILLKSKWLKANKDSGEVICRLDSKLLVEQLNGNYKIKQEHLRLILMEIRRLIDECGIRVTFIHVPREENKLADKLVNEALDEAKAALNGER